MKLLVSLVCILILADVFSPLYFKYLYKDEVPVITMYLDGKTEKKMVCTEGIATLFGHTSCFYKDNKSSTRYTIVSGNYTVEFYEREKNNTR